MIYRRIKTRVEQENWFAVAIDFFIVVFGIFAGFQVTQWNAERNDRIAEATVIQRLVDEYQENLILLASDKSKSQSTREATLHLMSLIAPQPDPTISEESVSQLFLKCLSNPKLIPSLGTTSSLMASGDLKLIRSPAIQSSLTQWQTKVQGIIEWQEIERMHGEELILGLTFEFLAWPTIDNQLGHDTFPSKLTSDFQGLFTSKKFEGLLHNRQFNLRASIERIIDLEADTQTLIEMLRDRLKEIR